MKIVSFHVDSGPHHTGALLPGASEVLDFDHPAAGLPARSAPLCWFDAGGDHLPAARALVARLEAEPEAIAPLRSEGAVRPREELCLLAPVPRPGKLLCIGLNYKDHAEESGMDLPEAPLIFSKFPTCVVGPGAEVRIPPGSEQVDYEAELAVVIGRRAARVDEREAAHCVLGYTNLNDVSARDFQFKDGQWQRGKSCDTFAPMGEYVATTDEVPEPESLPISFRLNGETLQSSNTDQLIFNVVQLVSYISRQITLEPGDVIATGTPPGVGFARKPPIYIQPGDRMEVEIGGLGVLTNPVVGPDA